MLSSIDINSVSVLRYEKERLEFCVSNKNDIEYIFITRWLENRIRELEHDWNALC